MLSLTNTTLPTGQLRAKLEGLDLPPGFKLPELELVLQDAAQVTNLMRSPPPAQTEGRNAKGESIGTMPVALIYNTMLPNLFKFSYFCEVEDVPPELLGQCIWALEWFIRALLDGSELQLRTVGHILPHQQLDEARYFMSTHARYKAATHSLKPEIDRPLEALRHLRAAMKADQERIGGNADMWKDNPGLFFIHAVALARSRTDDATAKTVLTRIINDKELHKGSTGVMYLVESKVYLSRVLRRLGEDTRAQEHEQWLIKWFKKNPHRLPDSMLIQIFTTDTDVEKDHILTGLGGENWLNNRRRTTKSDIRLTRVCRHCQAREPQVKLSQCSRCKHIFYCSRECQVANFPYHKESCKEHAAYLARIANMVPDKAQLASDWYTWRVTPVPANLDCLVHALGLRRDPSRSRTHIVFKNVEYVPKAKSRRDRFKVIGAAVFKLDDVWLDIERVMGLNKGEGKTYIKEMLEEFDNACGKSEKMLPMLDLMFGSQDIQTYLGMQGVSLSQVEGCLHDPAWRKSLNVQKDEVGYLKMRSGVQDSEKIF